MADYYKILGVSRNATKNDIDRAFYKIKSKFSSEDVEEPYFKNFYRRILEAYNVLSNDKLKAQYDQKFDFSEGKTSNEEKKKDKTPSEPIIKYFKSNRETLNEGEKLILTWDTSDADEVILEPGGKESSTGMKVIWFDHLAEGINNYNLTASSKISGKKISKNIQIKRKLSSQPEILKDSFDKPTEDSKEEVQDTETVSSVYKTQNSNLKKYAIPLSLGILLVTVALVFFNQSKSDLDKIQSEVVESLPTQEEETKKALIALNWNDIQREKETLIQNLRRSSKPDDQKIIEFMDGYRALVNQMNQTFYEDENYDEVSSSLFSNQSEIKSGVSQFLEKLENNGFKISQSEGNPFIEGKSNHLRSVIETNIHNEIALEYLDLYLESIDSPCCEDAGLMISYDDLIERTYKWGELITKAENSSLADIASRRFANHLYLLFLGIDNTPAFDYDSGLYKDELLEKLEQHKLEFSSSLSAQEVLSYLMLLESEGYKNTDIVVNYVRGLSGASFDLTSKAYFERFRDRDFSTLSNKQKIHRFTESENKRDFAKVGSFFAPSIKRYWDNIDVNYSDLRELYLTAWSNTNYSFNDVQDIKMIDENNFELITNFEYLDKEGDTISQLSSTQFTFNDDGLMKEVYGIDSDYTYKTVRDSDFDYISDEEKINRLLKAEDNRNFDKIASYYSSDIKRYWHLDEPTFRLISETYLDSWSMTTYSQNTILDIEKSGFKTYDVRVSFTFYNNKNNQQEVKESTTRYVFNDKGLINEVYGINNNKG
ncbi:J domain-containing protein [Salegentibacter mishustinae]|uniref:J domain-containing protein n=1 Tax=Salegentibacter mishustinae TaxID=270918 RepID=UPI00248F6773|nr:DnaJ domain-containing protein [Salegentibacter mishustinae]